MEIAVSGNMFYKDSNLVVATADHIFLAHLRPLGNLYPLHLDPNTMKNEGPKPLKIWGMAAKN